MAFLDESDVELVGDLRRRLSAGACGGAANPHSRHGRRTIECDTSADLDMKTLVWTRGFQFPLKLLESRMRMRQPSVQASPLTPVLASQNRPAP
jgi:hypothetical protein